MADRDIPLTRSPRYPRYPLPAAITYVRKLYEGAHRSLVDTETACKVMGFSGKTGASASAIGAMRQFGLVDAPKGGLRVSALGLRILEPTNDLELQEATRVAATHPTVFAQITQHFSETVPRSDEPLRSYLIRTLDFSRGGADECIASFRETLAFVPPADSDGTVAADSLSSDEPETARIVPVSHPSSLIGNENQSYRIPLAKDCYADLVLVGSVTERAIDRLMKHIELMKDVWVE